MVIKGDLMPSQTVEWGTPQHIFDELNEEFKFTLDACAAPWNYKVNNYYTQEDDGLIQPWTGTVWCNPPYGRQIGKWVQKAYEANQQGATVVMLIPSRTDTAYWHDYISKAEVRFIRGRLKFTTPNNETALPAPFPSAIVIFS